MLVEKRDKKTISVDRRESKKVINWWLQGTSIQRPRREKSEMHSPYKFGTDVLTWGGVVVTGNRVLRPKNTLFKHVSKRTRKERLNYCLINGIKFSCSP